MSITARTIQVCFLALVLALGATATQAKKHEGHPDTGTCSTTYNDVMHINEVNTETGGGGSGNGYIELIVTNEIPASQLGNYEDWTLFYDPSNSEHPEPYVKIFDTDGVLLYLPNGTTTALKSWESTIPADSFIVVPESLFDEGTNFLKKNQGEVILATKREDIHENSRIADYLYYYTGNGQSDHNDWDISGDCNTKVDLHDASSPVVCTKPDAGESWDGCDASEGTFNEGISISVADAQVTEGNSGTTTLDFVVTLSEASENTVTIHYATSDGTATTADNDYLAASDTLSISAGSTTGIISVTVNGDANYESDETLTLTLSSPSEGSLSGATATGTILNDDANAGCGAQFPSAAQNHEASGAIAFGWDSQVKDDPDNVLETYNLTYNSYADKTCTTAWCTAGNTTSAKLNLGDFQTTSSNHDVSVGWKDSFTLGSDGTNEYGTIATGSEAKLTDGGAYTSYRIKTLQLGWKNTVTLQAGSDYWIETLSCSGCSETKFKISGTGTTRVFIKNNADLPWKVDFNKNGGASKLMLIAYGDLSTGTEVEIDGLVYASGKLAPGWKTKIHGAIAAADIDLSSGNHTITYDSSAVDGVDHGGLCGETTAEIDHFLIVHDGAALTCQPEEVTVKACANSDCSELYNDAVSVTLTPSGWEGGDTLSFSGGTTTASLRHTTAETVTLAVDSSTPTAAGALVCDDGQGGSSCDLNFAESGFLIEVPTLTACVTATDAVLKAVKADPGDPQKCNAADGFAGVTRDVSFWSGYLDPSSGTRSITVNGTTVAGADPGTTVSVSFDGNAESTLSVAYADAGELELDAKYTGSAANGDEGLEMTGSGSFVSVPAGLYVYSDDTNSDCDPASATCSKFKPAGAAFTLKVDAVCGPADGDLSDNALTPNFNMADIPLTHSLVAPTGADATAGTLSHDTITVSNGEGLLNDQGFFEVGVITFTADPVDGSYFGETVPAGTSANIGRFYPDHFELSGGLVTNRYALGCTSSFTYMDEDFQARYTLNACNTLGCSDPLGTTTNYEGDFAKFDGSVLANHNVDARDPAAGVQFGSAGNGRLDLGTAAVTNTWNEGQASYALTMNIDRAANADGPFANLAVGVAPSDGDGVILGSYDLDTDGTAPADHGQIASTEVRHGRFNLGNAHGPETLPLSVNAVAEYWDGSIFTVNGADSCSALTLNGNFKLSNAETGGGTPQDGDTTMTIGSGTTAASLANSPLVAGVAGLSFSAPGDGNTGWVDITTNLSGLPYLQYDWDGDGNHDNEPQSRATFGVYSGSDKIIHLRQVY